MQVKKSKPNIKIKFSEIDHNFHDTLFFIFLKVCFAASKNNNFQVFLVIN